MSNRIYYTGNVAGQPYQHLTKMNVLNLLRAHLDTMDCEPVTLTVERESTEVTQTLQTGTTRKGN